MWIPDSKCPAAVCPLNRFNEAASSTFKLLDETFNITYGIGSVTGQYGVDVVTIGGATIPQQQVGLAMQAIDIYSPNVNNGTAGDPGSHNGILGLGYPSLTQSSKKGLGGYNPFVFNLVSQNIIKEPVFSIFLNSISQLGWSGEIIFGGVDNTKFVGDLTYMPVAAIKTTTQSSASALFKTNSNYYYWMVYAQGLAVKNSNTGSNPSFRLPEIGAYILDTGTTLTYLPTAVAVEVVSAFVGKENFALDKVEQLFVVDCAAASKSTARFELHMSQSSTFMTNPVILSVPSSELFIPVDGTTLENSKTCYFGIAPATSTIGPNMYLIGETVLRSAYMVFDMNQNRVGIAANKDIGGTISVNGAVVSNSSISAVNGTTKSNPNIAQKTETPASDGLVLKSSVASIAASFAITVAMLAL
jgi:hypothetical protein